VTGGIISALNRELSIEDRELTLIQTDAAVNPGNSGGPLVNSYGQVIGINSAKISSEYAEGLGFAIPIDDAKPIIDSLLKYGYVKDRPMLGIMGQTVTAAQARYNDVPQGVFVVSVTKDTGADKAGIKAGDIITAVNGKTVTTMAELDSMKKNFKAGDEITVSIYRDGKDFDLKVILTENKQ
jgi:serine protease Do